MADHTVDPAKFIVRHSGYPQLATYPVSCAKMTEDLLAYREAFQGIRAGHGLERREPTLKQLIDKVSEHIQSNYNDSGHAHSAHCDTHDYGKIRDRTKGMNLYTDLTDHYADVGRDVMKLHGKNTEEAFEITLRDERSKVRGDKLRTRYTKLTTLKNDVWFDLTNDTPPQATLVMLHAHGLDNPKDVNRETGGAQRILRLAEQSYYKALDPAKSQGERLQDALSCYFFLSHDTPFYRRSATLARVVLAYLEDAIGKSLPYTKENIDLNTQALIREKDAFLKEAAAPDSAFFDSHITSTEVIDWHKQACIDYAKKLEPRKRYKALFDAMADGEEHNTKPLQPSKELIKDIFGSVEALQLMIASPHGEKDAVDIMAEQVASKIAARMSFNRLCEHYGITKASKLGVA